MNATAPSAQAASASEVMALIAQTCQPLETNLIALECCLGRVLRQEIIAPEDQPPFDRSAVDGYAVPVDSVENDFAVVDNIRAGEWKPRTIESGQAIQVATGAALPCPGLQVVMKEDAAWAEGRIHIRWRGDERNIRFRGQDFKKGALLMQPGMVLTPGALARLAGAGYTRPAVTRLPRVVHAATGNEIVTPGEKPAPGQIRDTNSILVQSFLQQWGIQADQARVPEAESGIKTWLAGKLAQRPDLVLISGGASVGEHDFTHQVLAQAGFTIQICKTNTRPGKPLIFGTRGGTVAFGLPGNPLAHFVGLNLYVRAALEAMLAWPSRPMIRLAELASDLAEVNHSRETFWPATVAYTLRGAQLTPLTWNNSGDLTCLSSANALARIPAHCQHWFQGSTVEFYPVGLSYE